MFSNSMVHPAGQRGQLRVDKIRSYISLVIMRCFDPAITMWNSSVDASTQGPTLFNACTLWRLTVTWSFCNHVIDRRSRGRTDSVTLASARTALCIEVASRSAVVHTRGCSVRPCRTGHVRALAGRAYKPALMLPMRKQHNTRHRNIQISERGDDKLVTNTSRHIWTGSGKNELSRY